MEPGWFVVCRDVTALHWAMLDAYGWDGWRRGGGSSPSGHEEVQDIHIRRRVGWFEYGNGLSRDINTQGSRIDSQLVEHLVSFYISHIVGDIYPVLGCFLSC